MPVVNHRPSRIYWCTRRHWTRKWMKVDRPPPAFQKPASPLLIHEFCFSPLCLFLPPSLFTDSINPPFHPCRLVESFFLFFFSFSRKRVTLFEGISLITRLLRREWWNVSSLKQEWNESCYYDAWLISSIDREFGKNFHEIEISLNQRRIEILLKVDSK